MGRRTLSGLARWLRRLVCCHEWLDCRDADLDPVDWCPKCDTYRLPVNDYL